MKNKSKAFFMVMMIMSLVLTGSFVFSDGFEDPAAAVETLYMDYKNCTFNNALTYTTDMLHDHIKKIVDYSIMHNGHFPESFINQGQRMVALEIIKNEVLDDRYCAVVADWTFRIMDNATDSYTTKVKRFGFLLENLDGKWYIFSMNFITERIVYPY